MRFALFPLLAALSLGLGVGVPAWAARGPVKNLGALLAREHKSPPAREVGRALDLLQKGKLPEARKVARGLQADELFGDYGYWIEGRALVREARKALKQNAAESAIRSANRAREILSRVAERQPYSTLLKQAREETGQAELILGEAHSKKKAWRSAIREYENAFQRLQAIPAGIGMIEGRHLSNYASACHKKPSPLCSPWNFRLQSFWPRNAAESRIIAQALEGVDRPKPQGYARANLAYRALDLDQAAFEDALEHALQGKSREAIASLQKFLDEFPKSAHRHRARFWLAQLQNRRGETEKAGHSLDQVSAESPLSWYGLQSSIARGKDLRIHFGGGGDNPEATDQDPWLQPAERVHLSRAQKLLAAKRPDEAAIELRELRARDNLSSAFLTYLALLNHEAGNHLGAFNLVGELIQRGAEQARSRWALELIFPIRHWKLIQKIADQEKVDPLLVLSLMKQESAFDSRALSGSGANGLMQLMYATALETEPGVPRGTLLNPEDNIRVGTRYLRQLLARFNGNVILALAGYNAGPNAAARWLKDFRGKGLLEFIESIPYKETREYVAAILRNYYWYSARAGEKPISGFERFWILDRESKAAPPPVKAGTSPAGAAETGTTGSPATEDAASASAPEQGDGSAADSDE